MSHFYVVKAVKWKRYILIMALALFAALFLWIERDGAYSVVSQEEPTALTKGNANEDGIALTFNISWGDEKVHGILDELEKSGVQATFFVSGEWAENHPDIVEEITDQKHELGMLGYRYESYLEQDIETVREDLAEARDVFDKMGYEDVDLLRPPNGHFDEDIIELAEKQGLTVTHWGVNPNDWKNPGTQSITDMVMKQTENGDIILMHASDSAKQTANALQTILPGLQEKGFQFVTISELINQAHADSQLAD
ncbi:polysaccharide deacetylase family sporulation protein PdaB [Barrientosiimonas marina]|uniref:Polysaccharide deacetylase family sporulation protein PdaB n=1 Tax=Lentibacillus kimchii TaxID=1542911 RepID=A0ABW2UUB0_9BACI